MKCGSRRAEQFPTLEIILALKLVIVAKNTGLLELLSMVY